MIEKVGNLFVHEIIVAVHHNELNRADAIFQILGPEDERRQHSRSTPPLATKTLAEFSRHHRLTRRTRTGAEKRSPNG